METKECKICGRELPLNMFRKCRGGRISTCKECVSALRRENRKAKREALFNPSTLVSDPDFDGKAPREVLEVISRAKKWLESRGYVFRIQCEFHKTEIRQIKID